MATYRKLPSGRWQATVRLATGRRVTRTAALKASVRVWAEEEERKIRSGAWVDPKLARTVGQWLDLWVPARVVEPDTARADKFSETRIRAGFTDVPLASVTRLGVQAWVQRMTAAGVGAPSVRRTYTYLATALRAAVDEGLILATPCRGISLPQGRPKLPPWFGTDQVEKLVVELPEPHATMTLVMCWLGLRWGECAGLRVADVDWLRRRVSVVGAMPQSGGVWKEYPKTLKSRRVLPAPAWLIERMGSVSATEGLVFVSPHTGRAFTAGRWRATWYTALASTGLPRHTPHACRHTAATWLVQAGVPLHDIQGLLGHETIRTTERYTHHAPDAHERIEAVWETIAHMRRTPTETGR